MPADSSPEPSGGGSAPDPWAEQARRRGLRRRRRAIRGAMVVAGVLLVGWIAVAIWALAGRSDAPAGEAAVPAGGSERVPTATTMPTGGGADGDDDGEAVGQTASSAPEGIDDGGPGVTGAQDSSGSGRPTAASLVEVEEAWLLGHEDGTVDWGAIVESISDVDRGPIRIDAVFRDDGGAEVAATSSVLSGVAAGARAVVGGSLPSVEPMPARVQVDVAVGRPLETAAFDGEGLEVRALDRRTRPDGGEEATGLVVSTRPEEVSSLRLVLLWRDAAGAVVGSVARDIDRVRPGVPAHFTVSLGEDRVPEGLPTELMWSQVGALD